jgi:hypothetical protein
MWRGTYVRNIAVRTDQNPQTLGCDQLCCVSTAQMIEEPAAVTQPGIGHAIARMQTAERDA